MNTEYPYRHLLTGFTDEASSDLEEQLQITKTLGWSYFSARTTGVANIHELSEKDFENVLATINESNIKVAEFGTLIGSWSKTIRSDFEITKNEIERCIPRMKKLGVRFARVMSYAQEPWGDHQLDEERFKRLNYIVKRFNDAGLEALHENCMNYGGFSADHTFKLLEEVPNLRLVFDTGNPIFQRDRSKKEPHPWQNAFEFYQQVKHAVAHVHVKDGIMVDDQHPKYTFAGEGDGEVKAILKDLINGDYKGMIAIEPHMGKVFHDNSQNADPKFAYNIYLEYAQRFEKLLNELND